MRREKDNLLTVELISYADEHVGANKYVRSLKGRVEFDYRIITSNPYESNVAFYVIPMKPDEVEVGINAPQIQGLRSSFCRVMTVAPIEHFGDSDWHRLEIKYDFRDLSEAFYSIFAPRINEGFQKTMGAHLLVSNIQIYDTM